MSAPTIDQRLARCARARYAMLALVSVFAWLSVSTAAAQPLQNGDIVIPGNVVVDGFGNVNGVMWRMRGTAMTPLFQTNAFGSPRDMLVDKQGRLVFIASPASRNSNDAALFRIDPATGATERLFYFPYGIQTGDTIPDGLSGALGFYGVGQTLHLERSYSITIDDDVNGGVPQVHAEDAYGFAMQTYMNGQYRPMAYRYLPGSRRAEVGVDVSQMPNPSFTMAGNGSDIWYGVYGKIGHTQPDVTVKAHFHVGNTTVDGYLKVSPPNGLIYNGSILDNLEIPNVTIQCGNTTDDNVPMENGGFHPLDVGGLGVLNGSLYNTSNSVATGVPYMFNLQARSPFLNPYICLYYTAVTHDGPIPFWLQDGTATAPSYTSADGGKLLALTGSGLMSIDPAGTATVLENQVGKTGRPQRWNGGSSPFALARTPGERHAEVVDTTAGALVVRVDSLVNVLITDPLGRRIGYDLNGAMINELGGGGTVMALGSGWPRVLVVFNPSPGNYYAQVGGMGTGSYRVTAYIGQTGNGGTLASATGAASSGSVDHRGFSYGAPLSLSWYPGSVGVTPGSDLGAGFGFVTVGPVPSAGPVRFTCRTPAAGPVRLEIFDPAGRRVSEAIDDIRSAGLFEKVWSGEGDDGRRAAPGIYLARLSMPGRAAVRRVTLTR